MNVEQVDVRCLGPSDVTNMRRLIAIFSDAFDDPDSYLDRPPSDGYIKEFLERSDAFSIVAEVANSIVGGLVAYVLTKFEQERAEIYIYDLAVLDGYRRRGIATALIRELQRRSAAIGAYVIFVQADLGDDGAIALYESLGRREDVLHFDIDVE